MMPGTADGVVNHQPFCKRTVIVAAVGIDGDHLRADLHQEHFIAGDVTEQFAIGEIGRHYALRQIGSAGFLFLAQTASPFRLCSIIHEGVNDV